MRSALIGFLAGVIAVLLALGFLRQHAMGLIQDDIGYHFDRYVFDTRDFPTGDFDLGRVVRRFLFPARATVTFYDAHYREVTRPDQPGRYGAVVRMNVSGKIIYRFITLYHTASPGYWADTPWPLSAQLPPSLGFDPAVLRNQASDIAATLQTTFVRDGLTSPELAILLAGLSETSRTDASAVKRTGVLARDEAWWYGLRQQLGLQTHYRNMIDLPRDYDADPSKRWPLIVYISTGAERGPDVRVVRRGGPSYEIDKGRRIPAVVLSLQPSNTEDWSPEALSQSVDEAEAKYRIDPDRIYLTGGDGVWLLADFEPTRFAAIIPIDGVNDPSDAARLKDLPTWAFQGRGEDFDPVERTTRMLDAMTTAGAHPHLTLSDGHRDVWEQAFATDALYPWLLAQKRGQPEVITPDVPPAYLPLPSP